MSATLKFTRTAILVAGIALSSAAMAQNTWVPVEVNFTGTVSSGPENNITMAGQPYTGVTPTYPYQAGDPVSISFVAMMPSQQFLNDNPQIQTADGIYRYPVSFDQVGGNLFGSISHGTFDISGPMDIIPAYDGPYINGLTLVYDSNTGLYEIDISSRQWSFGVMEGPSYQYDFDTNILSPSDTACINRCQYGSGGIYAAGGTASEITIGGTVVGQEDAYPIDFFAGRWTMLWSGAWNLPTTGSTGGATQVPEPSVIVLFGSAAAGLMFARRRKRKAA